MSDENRHRPIELPTGEWFPVVRPDADTAAPLEPRIQPDVAALPGAGSGPGDYVDEIRPRRQPRAPRDPLAVAAFVCSLLGIGLLGIGLGIAARRRIPGSGRRGSGLATAAIVLGCLGVAAGILGWTLYFVAVAPVVTLP